MISRNLRRHHRGKRVCSKRMAPLHGYANSSALAGLNLDCRGPPSVTSSPGGGALHGAVLLTGQMLR